MNVATTKPARKHNCDADTNKRIVSIEFAPYSRRIVTTWRCRRCGTQWCTIWDPVQAEAERLAALRANVAETVAAMAEAR